MQHRLVIVDPAHASSVGHHDEVNRPLLEALIKAGWQAELWADVALEAESHSPQPLLGAFSGCGYEDPRHWSELGGMVNLARRLEGQLQQASRAEQPVAVWLGHSLLPIQLLGLARHLATAPAARVLLSLMFAPQESFSYASNEAQATANCRVALAALARATAQQGHELQLAFPSRQQETLYAPLLAATGLKSAGIHPAVVGAGCQPQPPAPGAGPQVLLHWGDLKAGKGRETALALLQTVLEQGLPASLSGWGWLFHSHSKARLSSSERQLLERAEASGLALEWLQGPITSQELVNRLACCPVALLAYDPVRYGRRSSGMLWHWAASRMAVERAAVGVGYATGWLAAEAQELGLPWLSPGENDGGAWLAAVALAAEQLEASTNTKANSYAAGLLTNSFGQWCSECLART